MRSNRRRIRLNRHIRSGSNGRHGENTLTESEQNTFDWGFTVKSRMIKLKKDNVLSIFFFFKVIDRP